jgi:hypothetical protein
MNGWLIVLMVAIVLGFAVVVWRLWDPRRADELEHESRLPLDETGESDLDE